MSTEYRALAWSKPKSWYDANVYITKNRKRTCKMVAKSNQSGI
jgi:hypothetical protein